MLVTRTKWVWFVLCLVLALGGWPAGGGSGARAASAQTAAPTAAGSPAAPGQAFAGCQWGYYPSSYYDWTPLRVDPEGTSLAALRIGSEYATWAPSEAQSGVIDFDGDGKSDLFRLYTHPSGLYRWQYSSAGSGPWTNMAYAGQTLAQLRFGDFNGDFKTDILAIIGPGVGGWTWAISYGGVNSYVTVHTSTTFPIGLAVGDFNGDDHADIFFATKVANTNNYQWHYYSAGNDSVDHLLLESDLDPDKLRFGDFDGNSKTDVFSEQVQGGTLMWVISSGGSSALRAIGPAQYYLDRLSFGDFDNDFKTDVFAAVEYPNGVSSWQYWSAGVGQPTILRNVTEPAPLIGNFDDNSALDLFTMRCSSKPYFPTHIDSWQSVFAAGVTYDWAPALGDYNGDGKTDLAWTSTCQTSGLGSCQNHNLMAAAAFSNGDGTFSPYSTQVLDILHNWSPFGAFAGDATGDGQAELLFNAPSDPNNGGQNMASIAAWVGPSLSISLNQALGPSQANSSIALGDFNGDGRMDFVASTVPFLRTQFGQPNKTNNVTINLAGGVDYALPVSQNDNVVNDWSTFDAHVGDTDGDGKADLIFMSTLPTGDVAVLFNFDSSSGFIRGDLRDYSIGYPFHYTGDFNGDGKTDLLWYTPCAKGTTYCEVDNNSLVVGLAQDAMNFDIRPAQAFGIRDWMYYYNLVGDVNGDGKSDIIWTRFDTANYANIHETIVALSNGDGTFALQAPEFALGYQILDGSHAQYSNPWAVDLNGDGRVDILWTHDNVLSAMLNTSGFHPLFLPTLRKFVPVIPPIP